MNEEERKYDKKSESQSSQENEFSTRDQMKKEKSEDQGKSTKTEIHHKFFSWRNRTHTEKTNLILAITSIASIFLIFFMTCEQNNLSRNALKTAETSNKLTRESLEFTKKATLASDSSTKYSLALAESSLIITSEKLYDDKRSNQLKLRAYIQVTNAKFSKFRVGEDIEITLEYVNMGQTPAYNVEIEGQIKPAGTGIYDSDWDSLKVNPDWRTNYLAGSLISYFDIGNFPRTLTQSDSIRIMNGSKLTAIMGFIRYKDIFGDSHFTQYCLKYYASVKRFNFYTRYNNAD